MRRNPPSAEKQKKAVLTGSSPRIGGIARVFASFTAVVATMMFGKGWEHLERALDRAFEAIGDGRTGPVIVSVQRDVESSAFLPIERGPFGVGYFDSGLSENEFGAMSSGSQIGLSMSALIWPVGVLLVGTFVGAVAEGVVGGRMSSRIHGWLGQVRHRLDVFRLSVGDERSDEPTFGVWLRSWSERMLRICAFLVLTGTAFILMLILMIGSLLTPSLLFLVFACGVIVCGMLGDTVGYYRQRAIWYRGLYMDDAELRREIREDEGDPFIRQALRESSSHLL